MSARGLAKQYGDFVAVDSIDFDVERGEAFGFLGPNGAGKSTTMRMIGCVSPASAGSLHIFGMDAATDGRTIRGRLGVVPQLDTLDKELSVMENLVLYGRYFDIPRAECRRRAKELLEFVQLSERADSVVDQLSGGMMRRLSITRSLINKPDLLLERAVRRMMPKGPMTHQRITKLKIYKGDKHPHQAQQCKELTVE